MAVTAVIGTQWGDEGKGKVVDLLAERMDYVVRFQGGNNAGHTIVVGDETYKLHLLPSGTVSGVPGVISNGCVVDPRVLVDEITGLQARGVEPRLHISDRAHLILDHHRALDGAEEGARGSKVGTTGRGIGPCYQDKAARTGVVAGDLLRPTRLAKRVRGNVERARRLLESLGAGADLDAEGTLAALQQATEVLGPFITDTATLLQDAARAGKHILLEGAQGVMLDIDHGTYPYVTSSSVAGLCSGSGLAPRDIGDVVGITKAYTTRVGGGPFPTELSTEEGPGRHMAEVGHEVGTTTGRPRRCGWLDLVVVGHAVRLCGINQLAVTKLDVLTGMDPVLVCTHYETADGHRVERVPGDAEAYAALRPVYQEFPGWEGLGDGTWAGLPQEARGFLQFLRERTGAQIKLVGTGPRRDQVILRQ